MIFKNFIELNSTVANGFIINDIISVLKQEGNITRERENQVLLNAINFVNLIQNGFKFLMEEKPIENLDKSLNAFNIAYNALKVSEAPIKVGKINQILTSSLNELAEFKKVKTQDVTESVKLFDSMRDILLKKAHSLSSIDEYPLEI